jgi:hypothetical protein
MKAHQLDAVDVILLEELADDRGIVRADARKFVVDAAGDGVLDGGRRDDLVRFADQPLRMLAWASTLSISRQMACC